MNAQCLFRALDLIGLKLALKSLRFELQSGAFLGFLHSAVQVIAVQLIHDLALGLAALEGFIFELLRTLDVFFLFLETVIFALPEILLRLTLTIGLTNFEILGDGLTITLPDQ